MDGVRDLMNHSEKAVFVRLERRTVQRLSLITSARLFHPQVGRNSDFIYLNAVVRLLTKRNGSKFSRLF